MESPKEFLTMIRRGVSKRVTSILDESDLEDSLKTFGAELLRFSARCGNAEVTRYLISKGCNVDATDSKGRTALMKALKGQHQNAVRVLLEAGADTWSVLNDENRSALHMFCADHRLTFKFRSMFLQFFRQACSSSDDAAQKLIDAGCHVNQAVHSRDTKILEYMLERDFSTGATIAAANMTALHVAVLLEDPESVKILLKHKADVMAADLMGHTPLFYVYRLDSNHTPEKIQILRVLLNESPASAAEAEPSLRKGNSEVVRVLLSTLDLSANAETNENEVLHCLASNFEPGVVDVLRFYSHKCSVNAVDKQGRSALQMAAIHGNIELTKFLLENGAKVDYAGGTPGRTALYYVYDRYRPKFYKRYDECIEVLLQHGANSQLVVTEDDGRQVTVFEAAVRAQKLKPVIAQLTLLEKLGTPITDVTRAKINSDPKLKRFYNRCQRVLETAIEGTVTLLKLITGSDSELTRYAGNKELVLKLERLNNHQRIRSVFTYFFNTLKKRFSTAIQRRNLEDGSVAAICRIFGGRLDNKHLILGRLNNFLTNGDLRQLRQI